MSAYVFLRLCWAEVARGGYTAISVTVPSEITTLLHAHVNVVTQSCDPFYCQVAFWRWRWIHQQFTKHRHVTMPLLRCAYGDEVIPRLQCELKLASRTWSQRWRSRKAMTPPALTLIGGDCTCRLHVGVTSFTAPSGTGGPSLCCAQGQCASPIHSQSRRTVIPVPMDESPGSVSALKLISSRRRNGQVGLQLPQPHYPCRLLVNR